MKLKNFTAQLTFLILFVMVLPAMAQSAEKPATNIKDALKYPRTENSMPGLFPGQVVQVNHE
ncbi:MAG: hypothetical protein Q8T08_20135, partial [Ignavibacteria bacterium]|nr:hypothetical protein [Ignavibacteria bacterium]